VASHGRQSVVEARLLNGTILIYGATGYTGRLIAKAASDRGARPILAGRNLDKVKRVAEPLGLSARAFDLGDPARIDAAIKDVSVVLCAEGPFSTTPCARTSTAERPGPVWIRAMPSAVRMREDYLAEALRAFARRSKTVNQSQRLLSLAAVRDGIDREQRRRWGAWTADLARLGPSLQRVGAGGPHRQLDGGSSPFDGAHDSVRADRRGGSGS
jgi:NADPH:quinone reductase-like Zn-dependent oxidoreductase